MGEVIEQAEIAYIKYEKDKGVKSLIAWFRAELVGRDDSTKERLGALTDDRLQEREHETESLAVRWREARLARSIARSVA